MQVQDHVEGDVPRCLEGKPRARPNRRQFLGLLATGTGASTVITGTAGAQESPVVSMGNAYFDPIGLHVEPGTTVRFQIAAGSHSATAYEDRIPAEASPFDSGVISDGEFSYTFDVPGTYDYYCIPHESMGMVGRIVVGEPGGPAEGAAIPEGEVPDSEMIVEQETVPIDEFEGSSGGADGGMMGAGMMDGAGPGWMILMPIGFVSALLALVGGVTYWAARRGTARARSGDPAMASLREQYARGEIDEEEFQSRRDTLASDE